MGEEPSSEFRKAGPYMNLGLTLALSIAGLAFLGNWLDGRWDTEPWLTVIGGVLGIVVGFVNLFLTVLPRKSDS